MSFAGLSFFSLPSFGVLMLLNSFWEQLGINSNNWYLWLIGTYAVCTCLFFGFLGNKGRIMWNNHLEINHKKKNDDFEKK
jgi:hypothetical protein